MTDGRSCEPSKCHRGGFLFTLNRSFRLASGKSANSCVQSVTMEPTFDSSLGLNTSNDSTPGLKPLEIVAPRIDTYRFSMANLEETQDADLDAILGELCALDSEYDEEISRVSSSCSSGFKDQSEGPGGTPRKECGDAGSGIVRTDSPDNDSAFSDTVSMLSSESFASSSASSKIKALKLNLDQNQKDASFQHKAEKIKLALERMREANIKKLFIKAFSMDGSSKSLLVDEKMTCGYVTRLLADKNHVTMEPKWAIVENLPDLHMERVYEDHEMLLDDIMLWTRESKNKIIFAERPDKISLFLTPEKFLLSEDDRSWSSEHDEHSRQVIIEEFFGQSGGSTNTVPFISGHPVPPVEGPLYLKSDSKKGWKKYYFVLRPSGLYYSTKDKVKTLKELVCLATFDTNEVYIGLNWKKKYKSPTDYCFAIKHPRLQQPKSVKFIKFLCADDQQTLERWVTAMRIAKHGRQLLDNYRSLVEELTQEDIDHLAHARSCSDTCTVLPSTPTEENNTTPGSNSPEREHNAAWKTSHTSWNFLNRYSGVSHETFDDGRRKSEITSIPTKTSGVAVAGVNSPAQSSNASVANSDISSGRHSRASSSSSSGCLSDGGTASESAFDCEFPMGTIKRKPSMKPNIPLTWMTRQLKEMAENVSEDPDCGDSGTLTRRPRARLDHNKRHHNPALDSNDSAALYVTNSNNLLSTVGNAVRHEPTSPPYGHYETIQRNGAPLVHNSDSSSLYGYTTAYERSETEEELPPPPPPAEVPDLMFSSTLSLDSLPPPPPPPLEIDTELSGSQLSLPPPPEHTADSGAGCRVHDIVHQLTAHHLEQAHPRRAGRETTRFFPRHCSLDATHSDRVYDHRQQNVAFGACLVELKIKKLGSGSPTHPAPEPNKERNGSMKRVNFADDLPKKDKTGTFGSVEPLPASPRKPPLPKRNESTRLSSPRKLADSSSNPPKDFLKDLQRVMRKKWQVAQKCKLEPTTTPHEVLGFREYPLSEDYKETSVSMWVQEHYGGGADDPFYENVFARGEGAPRREEPKPAKKRPPPALPRRSDSTHLTYAPAPAPQTTA